MSEINVLTEDLINKIAAGEVIERPSSVVKEFIENSLDADATEITIEIYNSGKDLIRVSDNGKGMDQEDTEKSILRHATSKISSVADLFSIETLGFRGEALASIASISQMSIITKQKGSLEGFNLVVEGGQVISSGPIGAEQGTTIEVRNIFYNTPVRKNFLKTDSVELRHIIDVVTRYALMNYVVSFKLLHEKHELLHSPQTDNLRNNIASIYGSSVAKELLEIYYEDDNVVIEGYIGKPNQSRSDKNQQVFFVNERWVRNLDLTNAVYSGYHRMLFVNKHPIFVLSMMINPQKIDVNVHPQKSEIKIEQKDLICSVLEKVVKKVLMDNNLIPSMDVVSEQLSSEMKFDTPKYSFEPSHQTVLEVEDSVELSKTLKTNETKEVKETFKRTFSEESKDTTVPIPVTNERPPDVLPPIKLLGQVHKTFFLAETPGGMLFIDQHAVHERVMYEKYINQYENNGVTTQNLLQGVVINLSASEFVIIDNNLSEFKKMGFIIEPFGDKTIILKSVPMIFDRIQPKELIFVLLNELQDQKSSLDVIRDDIIARMACRSAIMAGDELSKEAFRKFLDELANCEHPYTCAHGRPTMIKTEAHELEKKFKRC